MIGLQFEFLTGRYHATPWNRQVNEGAVEWPPSPWRILRTLIATWYLKGRDLASRDELAELVEALATAPPSYRLPEGMEMHTRHYMPQYRTDKGKTAKVFDAFVHLGRGKKLTVRWDEVELDDTQRTLLGALISRVGYLGRAESWVSGVLLDDKAAASVEINAWTTTQAGEAPADGVSVDTLLATAPAAYAEWRPEQVARHQERILADKRAKGYKEKLTASNRREIAEAVPESLFEALQMDTDTIHSHGWNRPPGSQWVKYHRPALRRSRGVSRMYSLAHERQPTVARYKVSSNVLPRLTEAIVIGDAVRKGLLSKSDGAPVFAGKGTDGKPLKGHRHVHVIPEALERHGKVSHVTVYAPMGFDDHAQQALSRLDKVWSNGVVSFDLHMILLGMGRPDDFAGLNSRAGHCLALADAKRWRSRTPFVPTRHPKTYNDGRPKRDDRGLHIGGPAHDLLRLLEEADLPKPVAVAPLEAAELGAKRTSWLDFRTQRPQGRGRRSTHRGFGFEIEFPMPVAGPICVGYGAHFGLGRFEPVVDK